MFNIGDKVAFGSIEKDKEVTNLFMEVLEVQENEEPIQYRFKWLSKVIDSEGNEIIPETFVLPEMDFMKVVK